jgi:hypothetical protein
MTVTCPDGAIRVADVYYSKMLAELRGSVRFRGKRVTGTITKGLKIVPDEYLMNGDLFDRTINRSYLKA